MDADVHLGASLVNPRNPKTAHLVPVSEGGTGPEADGSQLPVPADRLQALGKSTEGGAVADVTEGAAKLSVVEGPGAN